MRGRQNQGSDQSEDSQTGGEERIETEGAPWVKLSEEPRRKGSLLGNRGENQCSPDELRRVTKAR